MHARGLAPQVFELEHITSLEGLQQLAPAWADLYARSPHATPFSMPQWLIPWWKHFGHGPLWTLAVWHNKRLVGLAPLFLHIEEQGQRNVLLIGAGNSDYLDLLVEPGFETPVGRAVFDVLLQHHDEWDACHCQPLRESSALLAALKHWPPLSRPTPYVVCPELALPASSSDMSAVIPAGQLKKFYYYRRRASRATRVEVVTANEQNLAELLNVLFRLHRARWNERELPGVLASDVVRRFHQDVAWGMLAAGKLRLYALTRGSQWLAVFYGFSDSRRMYYYLGGFDPAYHQDSPGMLVVGHAIEQALCGDLESFDFLSGQEAYKYGWGARDQTTYRWQVTSSQLTDSQL